MDSIPFVDFDNTTVPLHVQYFDTIAHHEPDPNFITPIGGPRHIFDYGGHGEGQGFEAFGQSTKEDLILLRRMTRRALDRYLTDKTDTVFVFIWLQNGRPPVVAERVVFQERGWRLQHDRGLLERLGSRLHFNNYINRFIPTASTTEHWMHRHIVDRIETPLPGSFVFMRQEGVEAMPYFQKIYRAFKTHFGNSVRAWISENVDEDTATEDDMEFVNELRGGIAELP